MTIYTVGHKANYLKAMQDNHPDLIQKTGRSQDLLPDDPNYYTGGIAFKTAVEAYNFLVEIDRVGIWGVFVLACDWSNTYPDPSGKPRQYIIEDTYIVALWEGDPTEQETADV